MIHVLITTTYVDMDSVANAGSVSTVLVPCASWRKRKGSLRASGTSATVVTLLRTAPRTTRSSLHPVMWSPSVRSAPSCVNRSKRSSSSGLCGRRGTPATAWQHRIAQAHCRNCGSCCVPPTRLTQLANWLSGRSGWKTTVQGARSATHKSPCKTGCVPLI